MKNLAAQRETIMTDHITSKRIGYMQAFKAITIGFAIAYLMMAFMAGPIWLFQINYAPTIIFAVVVAYGIGYYFGGLTGKWILEKNRPAVLFGIIGGVLIVWSATFIGSLVGFVREGLPNQNKLSQPVHDYIFKPMILVSMFGFLPIVLIGAWFGLSIKKRGNKKLTAHNG